MINIIHPQDINLKGVRPYYTSSLLCFNLIDLDLMEKIEEQIVALEQKISSLEILLKRPFAQWTDEEKEEYGDKQQVREEKKQLRFS